MGWDADEAREEFELEEMDRQWDAMLADVQQTVHTHLKNKRLHKNCHPADNCPVCGTIGEY